MERKRKNANFINGVPELLVLKLLSANTLYGYQLVKEIQKLNPSAFDFGEGCIYPILHNLERDGLLRSESAEVGGRTRLYYHTTEAGNQRLEDLSQEWLSTMEGVGRLFGDALGGLSNAVAGLGILFNAAASASTGRAAEHSETMAEETGRRMRATGSN